MSDPASSVLNGSIVLPSKKGGHADEAGTKRASDFPLPLRSRERALRQRSARCTAGTSLPSVPASGLRLWQWIGFKVPTDLEEHVQRELRYSFQESKRQGYVLIEG